MLRPVIGMVLDDVSHKERQGLLLAGIALVLVSLATGFVGGSSMNSATGDFAEGETSKADIEDVANSIVEQQESTQEQTIEIMANQSENISESDLSFNGEVSEVTQSDFPSLYEVTISLTGSTVSRSGELEELDEEQQLYISSDGRYVFQPPTDLEAQQSQQTQPQQPQ